MKKLLIIIIILAGIGALYYMRENTGDGPATATIETDDRTFRPDASSATFTFDDEAVTLSRGYFEDKEDLEETTLLPETAYGDINNDGKTDSVVLLAQSGGGSFVVAVGRP